MTAAANAQRRVCLVSRFWAASWAAAGLASWPSVQASPSRCTTWLTGPTAPLRSKSSKASAATPAATRTWWPARVRAASSDWARPAPCSGVRSARMSQLAGSMAVAWATGFVALALSTSASPKRAVSRYAPVATESENASGLSQCRPSDCSSSSQKSAGCCVESCSPFSPVCHQFWRPPKTKSPQAVGCAPQSTSMPPGRRLARAWRRAARAASRVSNSQWKRARSQRAVGLTPPSLLSAISSVCALG
ncbi:hypothetical protein D3C71_1481160 [compost metagenome]